MAGRIFEYFVVCGIGPEIRTLEGNKGFQGTGVLYLSSLLDQYPSDDHSLSSPPPPQLPTVRLYIIQFPYGKLCRLHRIFWVQSYNLCSLFGSFFYLEGQDHVLVWEMWLEFQFQSGNNVILFILEIYQVLLVCDYIVLRSYILDPGTKLQFLSLLLYYFLQYK